MRMVWVIGFMFMLGVAWADGVLDKDKTLGENALVVLDTAYFWPFIAGAWTYEIVEGEE